MTFLREGIITLPLAKSPFIFPLPLVSRQAGMIRGENSGRVKRGARSFFV